MGFGFDDFNDRNGGLANAVKIGGQMLFSNGAWRELPYGQQVEADSLKPFERCRNIVRYWKQKLKLATYEFEDFKRLLTMRQYATEEEEYKLKALQKTVRDGRKSLKKAEADLAEANPNKPRVQTAEEKEVSQALERQRQDQMERISGLKI